MTSGSTAATRSSGRPSGRLHGADATLKGHVPIVPVLGSTRTAIGRRYSFILDNGRPSPGSVLCAQRDDIRLHVGDSFERTAAGRLHGGDSFERAAIGASGPCAQRDDIRLHAGGHRAAIAGSIHCGGPCAQRDDIRLHVGDSFERAACWQALLVTPWTTGG